MFCLCVLLLIHLVFCKSVCLSVCLCVYTSVFLSVCLIFFCFFLIFCSLIYLFEYYLCWWDSGGNYYMQVLGDCCFISPINVWGFVWMLYFLNIIFDSLFLVSCKGLGIWVWGGHILFLVGLWIYIIWVRVRLAKGWAFGWGEDIFYF